MEQTKTAVVTVNNLDVMSISEIAYLIRRDWRNMSPAARPYLDAMECLSSIDDTYIADGGRSIVLYFLANASTWKGDTARVVKRYLNALIRKGKR